MGRKCTTVYDGKSCTSGNRNSKFTGKIFGFPPDTTEEGLIERKRWLEALPNYVNPAKITCSVICEKHWKPGFEYKVVQNGTMKPIHPPTEFGTMLKSYKRQSVEISQPRNSKARGERRRSRIKYIQRTKLFLGVLPSSTVIR